MPETTPLETAFHELLARVGTSVEVGSDAPVPLTDPSTVWFVTRGHLDVVAMTITLERSAADYSRAHLLKIPAGHLVFGLSPPHAGSNVLILGFGAAGTELIELPLSALVEIGGTVEMAPRVAAIVDRWVADLCRLAGSDLPPAAPLNIRPGNCIEMNRGQAVQPQAGVVWAHHDAGSTRFLGSPRATPFPPGQVTPVGRDAWLVAEEPTQLTVVNGAEAIVREGYWAGLHAFHGAVEAIVDLQQVQERDAAKRRLAAKSERGRSTIQEAFSQLNATLTGDRRTRRAEGAGEGLTEACRVVGDSLGIEIRDPPLNARKSTAAGPLELIAKASRCRVRRVRLTDGWWRHDAGPLLGFLSEGEVPVAMLPASPGSYRLHNPGAGTVEKITPEIAASLSADAFVFYRSLPDRPLGGLDVARFCLRGLARDANWVLLTGAVGGVLSLGTPLALGYVFDTVIPGADRSQLTVVAAGLGVAALASAMVRAARNIAAIRVETRVGPALQAAVWDRMLNLPARFFADYSAGDLATRAMGVATIQSALSASFVSSLITAVFSVFSLAIMFTISPSTAVVAVGLCLVAVAVVVAAGYFQFRVQQSLQGTVGKMASLLLQLIHGMAKIRVAAAEDRAFGVWASRFSVQTRLWLRSRAIQNRLDVFNAVYPTLVVALLYYLITRKTGTAPILSTGEFLSFLAAYSALLSGLLDVGSTLVSAMNVVPVYERLSPILRAVPEVDESRADPGQLRGRIEVSNVTFRYKSDDPPVLDTVNINADPGEFIAIVGPSGSGKSTMLRILLGFERAESGSVSYDGFDLESLDIQAVRRQVGVVLQDGALMPGDIFTNIIGSSIELTLDDAWEAARMAGLDKDIEAMPMGMHTVIPEGGGSLSGGQRQRLMIARALVNRPRIVFFDEATSALDNPTQAIVTASLDRLNSTRVVIAHRLSTIVNADRIYVMDRGRVVQSGPYESLIQQPGVFQELARRQIA